MSDGRSFTVAISSTFTRTTVATLMSLCEKNPAVSAATSRCYQRDGIITTKTKACFLGAAFLVIWHCILQSLLKTEFTHHLFNYYIVY